MKKIACLGNITYDFSVSKKGFIDENTRNNFTDVMACPGGPSANAAYVLSKFGNNVHLYGKIGKDEAGSFVYNQMLKENIDLTHVTVKDNYRTPYSFIINNTSNSSRTICTVRDKNDFNNPTIESIDYETDYDYILIDGKYTEESIKLMEKNSSAKYIIDAGRVSDDMLLLCNFADYIICSEDFANEVLGRKIGNYTTENVSIYKELKAYFPFAEDLVITIGGRGYICEKDNLVLIMPAYKSEYKTVDTTGAGDIFHGAFVHALANGYSFHDSLEFANVTASLSTTKRGGRYSCPELEDVEKILESQNIKKLIKRK